MRTEHANSNRTPACKVTSEIYWEGNIHLILRILRLKLMASKMVEAGKTSVHNARPHRTATVVTSNGYATMPPIPSAPLAMKRTLIQRESESPENANAANRVDRLIKPYPNTSSGQKK